MHWTMVLGKGVKVRKNSVLAVINTSYSLLHISMCHILLTTTL